MHCNKCGSETPSGNYCRNCGAPLPKKGKQHKWALVLLYTVLGIIGLFALLVIIALVTDDGSKPAESGVTNATIAPEPTEAPGEAKPTAEPTVEPTPTPIADAAYEITNVYVKTWKNSIGTVWAQVIAEITNTGGKNLYLSSCSIDLEGSDGVLVKAMTMVSVYPQVIAPGEKAYYYDETTLDVTEPIELSAIVRPNVYEASVDQILLSVSDTQIAGDNDWGLKVKGRVENVTNDEFSSVYVAAVLRDADGKPLGVLFTIISENIKPGDKIGFEASEFSLPDTVKIEDVISCDVYAYPFQFQF